MNESVLQNLCEKFGVEWDVRNKSWDNVAHGTDGSSKQVVYRLASTDVDDEEGKPGTPVKRGKVRAPVPKYNGAKVRGTRGSWGLFEKHFRSEPQIYDPITSISETLAAAHYEVQLPEVVNESQRSALEDYTDWTNGWLHSIQGGVQHFAAQAGETLMIYGPSAHEVVWGKDENDWKHPVKFGYREPSTYEEYVLNEQEDELEAMKFEPATGQSYILQNGADLKADKPTSAPDKKLMHTAYHQRGNNFDGVPPTRPCILYKKLKKLLLQIAGLAADKYGMPLVLVKDMEVDLEGDWSPPEGTADDTDKDDLYQQVVHVRAGQAPVIKIPSGLDVQYEAPPGQMPTLIELLEYCDQQISQCFSNQGALLGQTSAVGSYALGKVSDDQFVRQAPAVAQMVFRPVNTVIRMIAQQYLEPRLQSPLPAYPYVAMRLNGQMDASKWIADVTKAMGGEPMTRWPKGLQKATLEKLDLPEDALEADEGTEVGGTGGTAEEEDPGEEAAA